MFNFLPFLLSLLHSIPFRHAIHFLVLLLILFLCRLFCFTFFYKGKICPKTGHEGPEGACMYSSILSLISAQDGLGGQRHASATLPPGKTRYPLYRRLGAPQGWSGRVRKISPPPWFDPKTVYAKCSCIYMIYFFFTFLKHSVWWWLP